MKISAKAIDNPRATIVGVLLVMLLAGVALFTIPVQRTPAIDLAVVLVAVPYPGAEPSEVEEQITRKIEDALQRLNKVDFIASNSMRGSSVTQVIFLDGVDPKRARDDVEHLINQIRNELPVRREVQPIITDIDFESVPLMLVNVSGPPGFDERALKQIAEDIQEDLNGISGVANTQLFGGREREIHVDANPDRLAEYGLSMNQLRQAIATAHAELPGGPLNTGEFNLQLRNATRFKSVEDIREVVVSNKAGRLVRVSDVAEVTDTYRRLMSVAQLDGHDCATIIVNKEANINTLGTAKAIRSRVEELQDEYPQVKLSITRDVSSDISEMFNVLGSNAIQGAAVLCCILIWSMGMRSAFLVITAIPFATAIGLVSLYALGLPISNMVLFSFILVLGMVVDGAIIVTENIHRHIERGLPPIEAAKIGVEEVSVPVIAADLTAVAAFGPLLLVPGILGDFMGVMPIVVSTALLGSLIVDHFLVPVLASRIFKQRPVPPQVEGQLLDSDQLRPKLGPFTRAYAAMLKYCLYHPLVALGCCLVGIAWSAFVCVFFLGFDFFPGSDRGQFEITYELPLGYSVEETLRAAKCLTEPLEELREKGELLNYVTAVGSSAGLANRIDGGGVTGPEFGKIMVQLIAPSKRDRHQDVIIAELRERIKPWPGMKYKVETVQEGPPGGAAVAVRMTGKDLDQLGELGKRLAAQLANIPGTLDADCDYRPDSPELVIEPDPAVAGMFDMSKQEISAAIQTAVLGDTAIELALDDEDVTLRVQAAPEFQRYEDDVSRLMITSTSGRRATIGEVANIYRSAGLFSINRYDRNRAVVARCDVVPDKIPAEVFTELRNRLLPNLGFEPVRGNAMAFIGKPGTPAEGVRANFTGENEEQREAFGYLLASMAIGVVLIFGILVIQFNSFRQAIVVMFTVPMSFIGVVLCMWLYGFPFSLASFIGLVSLTGVVVNDAIVLVDFANNARKRGMRVKDALMEAGIIRSRPVILTLATTVGDMLPLLLNLSGGAEFWQPLTGAVVFGLSVASLLTLIVVPVCYGMVYPND
jgi:multidrug efflux pump subunit AcrB